MDHKSWLLDWHCSVISGRVTMRVMELQRSQLCKREPMTAYRFGRLQGTLLRLGESGQVSMIG